MKKEETYKDGYRLGKWTYYNEDGSLNELVEHPSDDEQYPDGAQMNTLESRNNMDCITLSQFHFSQRLII